MKTLPPYPPLGHEQQPPPLQPCRCVAGATRRRKRIGGGAGGFVRVGNGCLGTALHKVQTAIEGERRRWAGDGAYHYRHIDVAFATATAKDTATCRLYQGDHCVPPAAVAKCGATSVSCTVETVDMGRAGETVRGEGRSDDSTIRHKANLAAAYHHSSCRGCSAPHRQPSRPAFLPEPSVPHPARPFACPPVSHATAWTYGHGQAHKKRRRVGQAIRRPGRVCECHPAKRGTGIPRTSCLPK